MPNLDLDRELTNLICFLVAAGLVLFAQLKNIQDGRVYDFANLSAGAALSGFGTDKKGE
jgi:hypothetical protein